MRRTTPLATQIRAALLERDTEVSLHRIEDWCAASLDPHPDLPFDRQIDHYNALAKVSGRGVPSDHAALRLSARGYPCDRLVPAIHRYLDITGVHTVPELDLSSGPQGDAAFDAIEEAVREVALKFPDVVPNVFTKLFEGVVQNAAKWAPHVGWEGDSETTSSVLHALLTSIGCYYYGGNLYGARVFAAACNINPALVTEEDLDLMNSWAQIDPQAIDRSYLSASADGVSKMALLLRTHAPRALDFFGVDTLTESEIDELSVVVAPVFLYGLEYLRQNVPEYLVEVSPALEQAGLSPVAV
jgi:hypothetical protein